MRKFKVECLFDLAVKPLTLGRGGSQPDFDENYISES